MSRESSRRAAEFDAVYKSPPTTVETWALWLIAGALVFVGIQQFCRQTTPSMVLGPLGFAAVLIMVDRHRRRR